MQTVKSAHIAFVVAMIAGLPIPRAHATGLFIETWVSSHGSDNNDCASPGAPCLSLTHALTQTVSGGQINVIDTADYGAVTIDRSVTIVNATSGTASIVGTGSSFGGSPFAQVTVAAGPSDIVTIRGLVLGDILADGGFTAGVDIINASRVNIENCLIQGETVAGIDIIPAAVNGQTLATSMNVVIRDSVLSGSNGGARISSAASMALDVAIERTHVDNNLGGGVRIDTSSGGPITVAISDSTFSFNGGNGINAVAGASQNIVSIKNSVIAKNGAAGVQVSGVNGGVLLSTTLLDQNVAGATAVVNGGNMFTYGNNEIVGSIGSGFNQTAQLH